MMTAPPLDLGAMPARRRLITIDERVVRSSVDTVFDIVRAVESWPKHLGHYRSVELRDRRSDGGGVVTMRARRPFGPLGWPVWWVAEMQVTTTPARPTIRFRHIDGITRGMEVEWSFTPDPGALAPQRALVATFVRIVHAWDGPRWPLIGGVAATGVIGPIFIHGIASRTLAGLARVAERNAADGGTGQRGDAMAGGRGDRAEVQG